MATVNSIALDLLTQTGEATDDPGLVALVEARINDALDEIAVATNWDQFRSRSTFTTTIGEAVYSLPVGGREIIQLRYVETGEPISNLTIQEAARRGFILETPGRARNWLPDGVEVSGSDVLYNFRLYPVPDAELVIERHFFFHPSLIETDDSLPVQDEYLVLVKDRARAYLYEREKEFDAADRCTNRFYKNLTDLKKRQSKKAAEKTVLRPSDLNGLNKPARPILDPDHYRNNW